jgi:hypothetical protein
MNEKHKDKLTDICDEKDWRLEFTSHGCIIRTSNGTKVEYQEDSDAREVEVRGAGRFRTVLTVLRVIDESRAG